MIYGILLFFGLIVSDIKMQPMNEDPMYYVGKEWSIKAPDKWQHMMGSYFSAKIAKSVIGPELAPMLILTGGAIKEYTDRTYLGWSPKDMAMNLIGVGAAVYETDRTKLLMDYKNRQWTLRVMRAL